jgi:hypothetical protein
MDGWSAAIHAVTGIVTRQSIPNTTESRKMLNPQGSFFVQSFPLKSVEQSSKNLSSSSSAHDSQNPASSYQSAVAGPSSTKFTSSLTSPDGPIANLAAYPKDRSEEELQVIQQTAAGCVENCHHRTLLYYASQVLQPVLRLIMLRSCSQMWIRLLRT